MSEWVVVDRWWDCPGLDDPPGYPEAEAAVYRRWRRGVVCGVGEQWAYQVRLFGGGVPDVVVGASVLRSWQYVTARRVDLVRRWGDEVELVEFTSGDVLVRLGQGLGYLEFVRRYGPWRVVRGVRVVGLRADAVVWSIVGGRDDVVVEVLGG